MKKFLLAALLLAAGGLATAFAGGRGQTGITVTGIPAEFNGRYALAIFIPEGWSGSGRSNVVLGFESSDDDPRAPELVLPRISNGRVNMPLHTSTPGVHVRVALRRENRGTTFGHFFDEYSGDHTGVAHLIIFYNQNIIWGEGELSDLTVGELELGEVSFSSGNAVINLSD